MSIQQVGWVLDHSNATGTDRLVLLSLANHANHLGESWPSVACLAHEANVSERRVQQCLAALVEDGRILRIINAGPDTRSRADRRPNLYRIVTDPEHPSWAESRGEESFTPSGERGERTGSHGVKDSVERGEEVCTLTVIEPSVEPSSLRDLSVTEDGQAAFERFWGQYPKRNGKRLGRANALKQWKRLTASEQRVALVGVEHYAASGQIPRDAERWLRDKCFNDWLEPAVNESYRQRQRQSNRAALRDALSERNRSTT